MTTEPKERTQKSLAAAAGAGQGATACQRDPVVLLKELDEDRWLSGWTARNTERYQQSRSQSGLLSTRSTVDPA
jgi:hypothetical protein